MNDEPETECSCKPDLSGDACPVCVEIQNQQEIPY